MLFARRSKSLPNTIAFVALRPWDEESDAADLMQSRLGGVTHRVDPGGGHQQLHDFDLELENGATVAVEVTRDTVASHRSLLSEVDRRAWRFPELSFDWVVDMIASYSVREVHSKIARPLAELEGASVDSALLSRPNRSNRASEHDLPEGPAREAGAELYALGARLVYRIGAATSGGGSVIMSEATQAGSTAPSVVVEVVEHHAALEDNVAKLSRANPAWERHLFIWVENSSQQAVATMAFGILPERSPELPAPIDAVWAVTAYELARIWRYHRSEGWRDLGSWHRAD